MKKQLLTLLCLLIVLTRISAQNFKVSENKDSLLHYLQSTHAPIDPEASAVILYEIGSSEMIGPITCYKYEIAYKVYNAKSIGNLADISIPKHNKGTIKKLRGITYNLENGNVIEQKLEKPDIIMENYADETDIVKFSMPSIKDGSVVTYSYEYIEGSLPQEWNFQRSYPVLYSRFNFNWAKAAICTPMINSSVSFKKYDNIKKMNASKEPGVYAEELHTFDAVLLRSWVRRDVPAFKALPLMGPEIQYLERIKMQYNGISDKGIFFPVAESWDKYSKEIWYDKVFPEPFQSNHFLDSRVKEIVGTQTDSLEIAKALFYYVQKNIQVSRNETVLSKILDKKQGSGFGINMLLCAMLRNAGLQSDLILLSHKESDKLSELVPNPMDVTTMVTRVVIDGVGYVMDATQKELPFGYLPLNYYNGYARVVSKTGGAVHLDPSMALNAAVNTVYLNPSDKGNNKFKFKLVREYGIYSGANLRKEWNKDSMAMQKSLTDLVHAKGLSIDNVKVEYADNIDRKVRVVLEGMVDIGDDASMVMVDPYFIKVLDENPLKDSKNRHYPIEYSHLTQEKYKIYIQLNDQYEFDDYPLSKKIAFGDPAIIGFSNTVNIDTVRNTVMIQCQYDNQAINLPAEEAEELKTFYNDIIKAQNQKIIFKRRNKI